MTVAEPKYRDLRWDADNNTWREALITSEPLVNGGPVNADGTIPTAGARLGTVSVSMHPPDDPNTAWLDVRSAIGDRRVTLGPQASQQWLDAPEHLAMVLARYRAAAALIGGARTVLEVGCGEGIGAGILARERQWYGGVDTDTAAIAVAREPSGDMASRWFEHADARFLNESKDNPLGYVAAALVALDVIEHVPVDQEDRLLRSLVGALHRPHGVCVIGTPNARFADLASPQSRAGHVNLYTHERLYALMAKHFRLVQSFGMQDTALHLGHPEARHYLLLCGIGPR